jgi:hypothetical protein
MVKLVLISLLLITNLTGTQSENVCDKLSIETVVTQVPGQKHSKLVIKATGGVAPYHYVLLDKKERPVTEDFKNNEFERLAPGSYKCFVSDRENCCKKLLIEIK